MSTAVAPAPRAVKIGVWDRRASSSWASPSPGGVIAAGVVLLALLGAPLFAVMGGSSEILWMLHPDQAYHHLRFRGADGPRQLTASPTTPSS